MRWIRPGSRRCDIVTAESAPALASILIPVRRWGEETTTPCPQPHQEVSEISQALSSQSTTGSLGTKPGCCSPLLLGVSPAQMWVSPSPGCPRRGRQGSMLPKFRPTQHFPLLFRFVSLVSLYFLFSILFVILWRRYGWICYEFSEAKQLTIDDSHASVLVFQSDL